MSNNIEDIINIDYLIVLNNHLDNLKNNSLCIVEDLNELENMLNEMKKYNERGMDISKVIGSVNIHKRDLKLFLIEIIHNIKSYDIEFDRKFHSLSRKTTSIVEKKNDSNVNSDCCCILS